jgi:hypothetical protein
MTEIVYVKDDPKNPAPIDTIPVVAKKPKKVIKPEIKKKGKIISDSESVAVSTRTNKSDVVIKPQIKIPEKKKPVKKGPPKGMIMNPETKRYVKAEGKTAKKVLEKKKEKRDELIMNPKSGRLVSINGKLGQQILREKTEYEEKHPTTYYAGNKVIYKDKPAVIVARNIADKSHMYHNTYDIRYENSDKILCYVHYDKLTFVL